MRSNIVAATLISYDFLLGCLIGLGVGVAVLVNPHVGDQAVAALLVGTAICIGLLGIVLAALAILVTFMGEEYLVVLDHVPGGFVGALWPYKVVGAISTANALWTLLIALVWGFLPIAWEAIALAIASLGVVWATVGTFQLLTTTASHGEQRAKLLTRIRQRRLLDRQREDTSKASATQPTVATRTK